MTIPRQVKVRNDLDDHRFVIEVDDLPAGMAVYHLRGDRYFFVHTEVVGEFAGLGLGTQLVRGSLDVVRAAGKLVVPLCPFFAAFIAEHDDYRDLVDWKIMDRIDRAG